jgi:hypothetical protein
VPGNMSRLLRGSPHPQQPCMATGPCARPSILGSATFGKFAASHIGELRIGLVKAEDEELAVSRRFPISSV